MKVLCKHCFYGLMPVAVASLTVPCHTAAGDPIDHPESPSKKTFY